MGNTVETLWVGPAGPQGRARAALSPGGGSVLSLDALSESLAASRPGVRRTLEGVGAFLAVALSAQEGSALSASDVERLQGLTDAVHEARTGRVRARALAEVAQRLGGGAKERLGAVAE